MRIINETTKNNKKILRTAHLQMMLLVFVLAMLCFSAGYFFAMAKIAQAVSAN